MGDFEQQWAVALKKAKRLADTQKLVPATVQKKQLEEELAYFKNKLLQSCKRGDQAEVEKNTKSVIKLLARQTVMGLNMLKSEIGTLADYQIKRHTQRYVEDCAKIISAAKALSETW